MFRKYLSVIFNVYHNETCKSNNMCSIFTALRKSILESKDILMDV